MKLNLKRAGRGGGNMGITSSKIVDSSCRVMMGALLLMGRGALAAAEESPAAYPLSYPAADQFCPPVAGFFEEIERTIDRVGGHTFRHPPNGGYGLPVVIKVGDQNLIHLGTDTGWYQVGAPVFAVANGVVRVSQGAARVATSKSGVAQDKARESNGNASGESGDDLEGAKRSSPQPSPGSAAEQGRVRKSLEWGNVVVIEHKLADGKFATTIYGHLANDRLVKAGDIVTAGQQIGTIGNTRVNGGYKPHVHLGVRDGRMAEVGRKLLVMLNDGQAVQLEIAEVREDRIVVKGAANLPEEMQVGADGRKFRFAKNGETAEVDPALLAYVPSPEFLIVGYGLSTDGWQDPVAFLRAHGADVNPAAFVRGAKRQTSKMQSPK